MIGMAAGTASRQGGVNSKEGNFTTKTRRHKEVIVLAVVPLLRITVCEVLPVQPVGTEPKRVPVVDGSSGLNLAPAAWAAWQLGFVRTGMGGAVGDW